MDRRDLLRHAAMVGGALVSFRAIAAGLGQGASARASAGTAESGLRDEGVGTYTDPSVAGQLSYFTINPRMVSCGVGPVSFPAVSSSGPFAMLMYATHIRSYRVDRAASTIEAIGRLRSITRVFGSTLEEDVEHDFLAIAVDSRGLRPDRFDVHFTTPFWNRANPMCTPSDAHPGWCRFGGHLVVDDRGRQMGEVTVAP